LIASLRDELQIGQKNVIFNGKRFGCVYSLKTDLSDIPDAFQYRLSTRIRRVDASGSAATPYQQIAKEVKAPRERLKLALEEGCRSRRLTGFSGLVSSVLLPMCKDCEKLAWRSPLRKWISLITLPGLPGESRYRPG
jgi:hypothetical protein